MNDKIKKLGNKIENFYQSPIGNQIFWCSLSIALYTGLARKSGYRMVKPAGRTADGDPIMATLSGKMLKITYDK